jgi:hypothetical protein
MSCPCPVSVGIPERNLENCTPCGLGKTLQETSFLEAGGCRAEDLHPLHRHVHPQVTEGLVLFLPPTDKPFYPVKTTSEPSDQGGTTSAKPTE